jgi:hypothetical protein
MKNLTIGFLIGLAIGLLTKCNKKTIEKVIEVEKIKVETLKVFIRDTIYLKQKAFSEVRFVKCDTAIVKFDYNFDFKRDINLELTQSKQENLKQKNKHIELGIDIMNLNPAFLVSYKNVQLTLSYDIKRQNMNYGFFLKKEF